MTQRSKSIYIWLSKNDIYILLPSSKWKILQNFIFYQFDKNNLWYFSDLIEPNLRDTRFFEMIILS